MDSVLEDCFSRTSRNLRYDVSILVSVDSVLEDVTESEINNMVSGFNPSFCGFGIGGDYSQLGRRKLERFQS